MSKTLVIIGLSLAAIGLLWPLLQKAGLGRLPGDIVIKRDNFTLYFPVATMIVVSVALSIVLSVIFRLFK